MNKFISLASSFAFVVATTLTPVLAFQADQSNDAKQLIRGNVTTPKGKPAANAIVMLVQGRTQSASKVTADELGRFEIELTRGADHRFSTLAVLHPSGAIQATRDLKLDTQEKLEIKLQEADKISLKLFHPDGSPLKSGKIRLNSLYRRSGGTPQQIPKLADAAPMPIVDGTATLGFAKLGDSVSLEIESPDLPNQSTHLGLESNHQINLRQRATVRGKIRDPEKIGSFEGVKLNVASYSKGSSVNSNSISCRFEISVNDDGTFETDQLCVGKLSLSASRTAQSEWYLKESYNSHSADALTLSAGQTTEVELTMKRAIKVSGRFTDEGGNPLAGVELSLQGVQTTSDDGKFGGYFGPGSLSGQVLRVPKGFLAPGGIGNMIRETIPQGKAEFELPDIQLEAAAEISGVVLDEEGQPVANAQVVARWMARLGGGTFTGTSESTKTNEHGEFVLENTSGKEVTSLSASSKSGATLKETTVRPGAKREVEITISKSALLAASGKVVDSDGTPILDAKIELWHHYGRGTSSVIFFDSGRKLPTNAKGEFSTPSTLRRSDGYSINVEAPGFSSIKVERKAPPAEGDLDFGTIKLKRSRGVAGRIIDSAGQPIAGVTIWSFKSSTASRKNRISCKSDSDGKFSLSGIATDSHFFFVEHPGYRFRGRLIQSKDQPNGNDRTIKMARIEEPSLSPPVKIGARNAPTRAAAATSLLMSMLNDKEAAPAGFTRSRALKLLSKSKPQLVPKMLNRIEEEHRKLEVLLAAGEVETAIEFGRTTNAEITISRYLLASSPSSQNEYACGVELTKKQRQLLLEEAFSIATRTQAADKKIQHYASLAIAHLYAGNRSKAEQIVQLVKPLVANNQVSDIQAGLFATAIAPFDPDLALKTLTQIERDFTQRRFFSNALASSAFGGHEAVEKFLKASNDPVDNANYLRRAVFELAKLDLDKTLAMVDESQDRYGGINHAKCYGNMAMAVVESNPQRAKELLRAAFEVVGKGDPHYVAVPAFTLLRYAQFVDPESTGEYWWRAVAMHGGLQAGFSNRPAEMEKQERRASLALLLILYGQQPEVQQELVEPLLEYWESVPAKSFEAGTRGARNGIDFRDSLSTFAAMALYDPERTVKMLQSWWPEGHERFNRSPDAAWIIVADVLTANDDELHRLISKRIQHQWILGDAKQY